MQGRSASGSGVRAAGLLLAVASVAGCHGEPEPSGAAVSAGAPDLVTSWLNHDPSVGYVGREACRECHADNSATFDQVGMGRSFYPLDGAPVVEDWTDDNELIVGETGLGYRMFERDGKYFQAQFVIDSQGRETARSEHELIYVVGSNHHSRGYITLRDGKLFQAPVCWDPTKSEWILCPGYEIKNDHYSREISTSCVFCHNGRMEVVAGERNLYREPIPHGIGCERCHGPGELHVARARSGEDAKGQPTRSIVYPRRVPRGPRTQICFQCHLGDTTATVRVKRYGREPEAFRPGQPITEVLVPFRYEQQTQWDFGLVSQADRMILSRCFTESDGKLECTTCHNPHITVYDPQRPVDLFRVKCLGCHQVEDCDGPPERREATADLADDCVACHMRRAVAADRKYALFTDHWIRRDTELTERDPRTRYDLEPIFPEALAGFPPGEQSYYRARADFLMGLDKPQRIRQIHWERAERHFHEAIERGFDVVESWFFLGKIRLQTGRFPEALEAFEHALERDPAHHDSSFARGQTLALLGRVDEARRTFGEMLERDADNPMALAEFGRTSWMARRFDDAIAAYDRALEQEPWNPTLHLNYGMTLASVGRFDEAARSAVESVRWDPDGFATWEFYANVMEAAGRTAEAAEARRRLEQLQRAGVPAPWAGSGHGMESD